MTLGQGSLLVTCKEGHEENLLRNLRERGISAARIGEVVGGTEVDTLVTGGRAERIKDFTDRYWQVYEKMRAENR
jgi:hydrogenase maturation factor